MSGRWLPFQGGHYRLPTARSLALPERKPVAPTGEIHLGPGWRLTEHGALAKHAGRKYRCNASHNAGILYHEYGHHITRHTADFQANWLKAPHRQSNKKTALDEGVCDYWVAAMLHTPHIWAWHRRHDQTVIHSRSLASRTTMADFDVNSSADPHTNGTIWAACLWDIRAALCDMWANGGRRADLLVLKTLLLLGCLRDHRYAPTVKGTRLLRNSFGTILGVLLEADATHFDSAHRSAIIGAFERRGIQPPATGARLAPVWRGARLTSTASGGADIWLDPAICHIRSRDPEAIIPDADELLSSDELEKQLVDTAPFSLVAVGDIMIGARARRRVREYGPEYPFFAVLPLFRRAGIVLANLEGPFAKRAEKLPRHFAYKMNPQQALVLRRAGINVVTLANNHILDCGRQGVLDTLQALEKQRIAYIGAGINRQAAHKPAIMNSGRFTIGLLGYYWNRRTAATKSLPGSAMDVPEYVAADIEQLRPLVDWIVVTVHWGVPYERTPTEGDRIKARFAIDCGADIVIGHHPHIIQAFEMHRGRPIFYSVGNFVFGSGNSRSESLILGVRFDDESIDITVYPAYVKNRDLRANYQPKVMAGNAARRMLSRLKDISGDFGDALEIQHDYGRLKARSLIQPLRMGEQTRA
ncbi:MAG: CapA family protein [Pirellulaceae bacterium]